MDIKYIVVHCSATKASLDIGAKEIDAWHKAKKWNGIGYHFVIRRDGTLELGRPLGQPGAHVQGFNSISWGICMVGGVNNNNKAENNFTNNQFNTLEILLKTLNKIVKSAKICGHRDMSEDKNGDGIIQKHEWAKECPCFEVSEFLTEREILCKKKSVISKNPLSWLF